MDRGLDLKDLVTLIKLCRSYTVGHTITPTLMVYTLAGVHLCVHLLLNGGLLSKNEKEPDDRTQQNGNKCSQNQNLCNLR